MHNNEPHDLFIIIWTQGSKAKYFMKFVKMSNDKIKGFEPFFGPVRTTTKNSLEFRVCKKFYKIIL